MKNENYVLLKDLPDCKAGMTFKFNTGVLKYYAEVIDGGIASTRLLCYPKNIVEKSYEWFIKESEYNELNKKKKELYIDLFEIFSKFKLDDKQKEALSSDSNIVNINVHNILTKQRLYNRIQSHLENINMIFIENIQTAFCFCFSVDCTMVNETLIISEERKDLIKLYNELIE